MCNWSKFERFQTVTYIHSDDKKEISRDNYLAKE